MANILQMPLPEYIMALERENTALREALAPFSAFAEKAEAFVAARAKDGGSPIMPSTDFRLADFKRAAAALSSDHREKP